MALSGKYTCCLLPAFRLVLTILFLQAAAAEPITRQREAELINMIRHDCGSCHGISLRGGLGPPLTPDALIGKNHGFLYNTIISGRENTAMPPWQGILSEEDIEWIVMRLQEGNVDTWRPDYGP